MFVSINVWSKFSHGWADIKKIWNRKLSKEKNYLKEHKKHTDLKLQLLLLISLTFQLKPKILNY